MEFATLIRTLVRGEDGQDLLEYALLVALIALVAFAAVQTAGLQIQAIFNSIATTLQSA